MLIFIIKLDACLINYFSKKGRLRCSIVVEGFTLDKSRMLASRGEYIYLTGKTIFRKNQDLNKL